MALTAQLVRDDRRADRETLDVGGTLRHAHNVPHDVIIEDLSATGFRVRTTLDLDIGEKVSIGIPGIGQRHAHVVRRTDDGFGCELVEEIDSRMVAAPLTAQPVVTGDFGDFGGQLDLDAVRRWSLAHPPQVEPYSRSRRLLILGVLGGASWLAVLGILSLL